MLNAHAGYGAGEPIISTPGLERALREVARRIPGLRWATVASLNGLIQSTYDPFGRERPDRILAMASAILALGKRVFRKLQRGQLTYLTLAGDRGTVVVYPIGGEHVLAVSIPRDVEVDATLETLAQVSPLFASALCVEPR